MKPKKTLQRKLVHLTRTLQPVSLALVLLDCHLVAVNIHLDSEDFIYPYGVIEEVINIHKLAASLYKMQRSKGGKK